MDISLKPDVSLEISLPKHPVFVSVDPGQFESALFNLLLNANNAIDGTGKITVRLRQSGSEHAKIVISDTGQGMTKDVLAHAIEPFFTTRENQGGTGLGLSIVYGFILQTGGKMNIESAVGQGTEIEISLPVAVSDVEPDSKEHRGCALLVEDDPSTRETVRLLLQRVGLDVKACATAADAFALLHQNRFDVLLSDLDLGCDTSGLKLIEFAHKVSPQTNSILMSGKPFRQTGLPDHAKFLQKPVTPATLTGALHD